MHLQANKRKTASKGITSSLLKSFVYNAHTNSTPLICIAAGRCALFELRQILKLQISIKLKTKGSRTTQKRDGVAKSGCNARFCLCLWIYLYLYIYIYILATYMQVFFELMGFLSHLTFRLILKFAVLIKFVFVSKHNYRLQSKQNFFNPVTNHKESSPFPGQNAL